MTPCSLVDYVLTFQTSLLLPVPSPYKSLCIEDKVTPSSEIFVLFYQTIVHLVFTFARMSPFRRNLLLPSSGSSFLRNVDAYLPHYSVTSQQYTISLSTVVKTAAFHNNFQFPSSACNLFSKAIGLDGPGLESWKRKKIFLIPRTSRGALESPSPPNQRVRRKAVIV